MSDAIEHGSVTFLVRELAPLRNILYASEELAQEVEDYLEGKGGDGLRDVLADYRTTVKAQTL